MGMQMAQGGWAATGQEILASDPVQNFMNYMARGGASLAGYEPTNVLNAHPGAEYWRWGPSEHLMAQGGSRGIWANAASPGHAGLETIKPWSVARAGMWGSSIVNPLLLGVDLAQGFAQGGIWGAKDALMWNVAQNAAMASHIYSFTPDKAGIMVASSSGMIATMGRGLGASVGATVGQSIAGTPGAFAGAYIGAAPLKALSLPSTLLGKIPRVGGVLATGYSVGLGVGAAGALGVGMAAATTMGPVYAAYKATQFGAQYHNQRRNINTAGDLSAFMTNNASTMRARAVQAIGRSQISSRSALGMEAGFLHTRKSYNSSYRQGWM